MSTQTISINFIIAALEARFEDVKDIWGNEASLALWDQVLDMVEEYGISENTSSASEFVDNYLINGEFVTREGLNKQDATSCGIELDDDGTVSDDEWQYLCDNAVVYNGEYACIRF